MSSSSSDSDVQPSSQGRLFGRRRSMHHILGGGRVAEILLWENKNLSAAILIGITIIWFLFEVMECNIITLLSHISIIIMLIMFLWSTGAGLADWIKPPEVQSVRVPEETLRWLMGNIGWLLTKFCDISSGKDFKTFFLIISVLWALSVVGSSLSSLSLFYTGSLSLMTLPAFYERYENEVNRLAFQARRDIKRLYKKFDSKFLSKIPRGPVKEKKRF